MVYGQNSRNHIMKIIMISDDICCILLFPCWSSQNDAMTFQTKQQSSCLRIVFGHLLASPGFAIEQKPINTVTRSIQQNETKARFVLSHEPVHPNKKNKVVWLLIPSTRIALSQRTSKPATLALLSFEEAPQDGSLLHTSRKTKRSTIAMVHPSASC